MAQRKFELIVGAALIAGVASYSWIYHFSNDESNTQGITDVVVNEISELSGLKVSQTEFEQTTLADPFTHLAINGETWFSQTSQQFESTKALPELPSLPEIPEDAWYSPDNVKSAIDIDPSTTWNEIKTEVESYFSESE